MSAVRTDPHTWAGLVADLLNRIHDIAPEISVGVSEYGISIGDPVAGPVLHVDTDENGKWVVEGEPAPGYPGPYPE